MKFPCPTRPISCPGQGNLDYDSPFANLSSERPDHPIYVGVGWGPFDPPPLGGFWEATGCLFICESIVSQADADLCAAEQADFCTWGGWGPPGGGPVGPPGGGGGSPIRTFANRQQQCSAGCPDGSVFTWTILANTYFATSQAQADLIASSEACAKAAHFFFCLSSLDGNAQVGVLYSLPIFITGANRGPFTFVLVDGALPPGIILSPGSSSSVIVNGKPTTAGTYTFTIQASDPGGNFIRKTYTITVTSTCTGFWSSLNGLWVPNTGGPNSVATVVGSVITLSADAPLPGPSTGTAQLTAQATSPTTGQLTCSLTVQSVTVFNPPPPANTQFSILIQDAVLPNVYLNVSFSSATMPAPGTVFSFTMPTGATPQISLICFTINALNGSDSIIGATLLLG